ncbi:MAG: MBL fold metallo-hydrolase, partial [Oscillospiraceae bacterium]|nr:MBL fold metallo-hydrolase [Oscillospiraceae bacterium]
STYYSSDPGTLRTNGYIISAANDTDTYTRLIQNCVFDTTEKTAVDVTNGMVWVLRGNIYADAGRTSGSQTVLAALPDLAVMDGEAVLYGYLTNGSDKTGNSPADGVTEEITWRLTGGDKVTADYAAYTAALVSAGYTAYTSNTIGANLFGTYTKGDVTVTVAATPGSKTLRVIADTGVTLPAIAPVAAGSATPTVTMLGTGDQEHLKDSNRDKCFGMSFIFRLSDGHFIVVDGGYDDAAEAERLYDKLTELSGGTKPVIDTWILTHSHRDHVGAFTTFAAAYGSSVTLNSVTFNFPNVSSYNENLTNGGPQNTLYRDAVLSAISTYFPGATVYKPHPGTVMQFAGTEVEFLYTYELSAPNDLWNFNDSSLVFTVTINGQRIMMTGDCAQPSTEAILANYTVAELECDALQMAHHGYYNNIVQADFYKWAMGDTGSGVTEKKLAFWPGCELYAYTNKDNDSTAAKDAEAAANAYLIAEPNVKIVVAGDRNADPGEYTYEILTTGLKNAGVVATVGDDEFAMLADAIAAAEAGGTITLLGDLELDGETFTKNVTLTAGEAVALTGTAAVADGVTVTAGGNVSGGVFELQGSGAVSGASYGSYGTYATGDGKTYFMELTGKAAVIDETLTAYDTLAEAVAAAEAGQTVVIVADTVVLDGVVTLDKAITVTTEGDANVTVYASARDSGKFLINITAQNVKLLGKENARLILDGRLNGTDEYEAERGVLGVQGANAEVAYVTVQNGLTNYTSGGGGVYVGKVAELSHCEVRNCAATNKGGAIYVANAGTELTLTDSVLDGNTASGQYGGGALYIVSNAKVMMERCVVSNNTATNTAKQTGGAVFVAQSGSKTAGYLVATDTEFTGNSTNAVEGAGAIVFTGVISLERCTFSGNDSNVPILLAGNTNASYTCNSAAVSRRITDTIFDAVKSEAISGGGSTIALTDNVYKTDVSVTLAADLGLNFYVTSDAADAVMTFTVDGVDTVAPLDEANGRYTARLTAKEMNKTVTATLSHGEKTLYTVDYSVEEYLNQLTAEGSGQTAAVKAAAEAVKHYGEAAALYFDPSLTSVNAAELAANLPSLTAEGVTSYYEADEDKVTTAEGISFYGKSLLCKDTTLLRLYFTAGAAPAVTVAYGETAVDVTVTAHADGQHYYVDIPVAAARLSGSFAVTATLGESTLSFDMGVYDYIRQALTLYADNAEKTPLTNMCKALWQYSESVKTLG